MATAKQLRVVVYATPISMLGGGLAWACVFVHTV